MVNGYVPPYNFRNNLWKLKYPERCAKDNEVSEQGLQDLYEAIKNNINFFKEKGNYHYYFTLPMSIMTSRSLKEVWEQQERFNNTITGLFGCTFDNATDMLVSDAYGRTFRMQIYNRAQELNPRWEICVYDMSGQFQLLNFVVKGNKLSPEQNGQLQNCWNILMQKYKDIEISRQRYEEIRKYHDYFYFEDRTSGYAHYTVKVRVRKDIPITLTTEEIAKYVDDWNYCFGGHITHLFDTDTEKVYEVKVYTD